MAEITLTYGADGTPATVEIDGVTYRVHRVDGDGRQIVTLDVDGDVVNVANENYGSAQTNNELVAAPGAGVALYVAWLEFSTEVAGALSLTQSSGSPATVWGPHYFAAASGHGPSRFSPPIPLNANSALRATTDIAGDHTVTVGTLTK
jgi:hypothetical protein